MKRLINFTFRAPRLTIPSLYSPETYVSKSWADLSIIGANRWLVGEWNPLRTESQTDLLNKWVSFPPNNQLRCTPVPEEFHHRALWRNSTEGIVYAYYRRAFWTSAKVRLDICIRPLPPESPQRHRVLQPSIFAPVRDSIARPSWDMTLHGRRNSISE